MKKRTQLLGVLSGAAFLSLCGIITAQSAIGSSRAASYLLNTVHQESSARAVAVQSSAAYVTRGQRQSTRLAAYNTASSTNQPSSNWGGYIAEPASSTTAYTSVTGSWTVPNLGEPSGGVNAQWIGLGGVSSSDLLQIGTIEQSDGSQQDTEIFWEKLPAAATNIATVPTGSKISASIRKTTGSTWELKITATPPTGNTINKDITVQLSDAYASGIGTSAEWITEDPSTTRGQLYPLAPSDAVTYSNATVDGQPIASSANQVIPVEMVDNGSDPVIVPGSLGSDEESFTTTVNSSNDVSSGSALGQGAGGYGSFPSQTGRKGETGWSRVGVGSGRRHFWQPESQSDAAWQKLWDSLQKSSGAARTSQQASVQDDASQTGGNGSYWIIIQP